MTNRTNARRLRWVAAILLTTVVVATGVAQSRPQQPPPREPRVITIGETGQAALAQPKVMFELRNDRTGEPLRKQRTDDQEIGELLGVEFEPLAFLDTGASSFVFSKSTADRFGLVRDERSRFVETGVSGEHAMNVTIPYAIAVASHPRAVDERGRMRGDAPPDNEIAEFESKRLLINDDAGDVSRLMGVLGNAIDVIGMPAIDSMTVEVQPQRSEASSVPVRVLPRSARPRPDDVWLVLEMLDFSFERHPGNTGPLPALSSNPFVTAVKAIVGEAEAEGDWLLDTGSAVTIISKKVATEIGLLNDAGEPAREPDFKLPMGGISGDLHDLPGWRIDAIELPADRGVTIRFERPFVLVHDITVMKDGGEMVTIDGVFGMNLLLQSGAGFNLTGFDRTIPSPFESIIIDGRRARLGLRIR